jgi:WXG100 family type VII secretion target
MGPLEMTAPRKIEVNNQLESFLNGVPGEIQSIVRPLADPFIEAIEMVSGDPDDLTRAAEVWRSAAGQVRDVADQQKADVARTREHWKGEASDAFGKKLDEVGQTLEGVSKNLEETSGTLVEAAKGCAESANLILDILVDLLMMLITDLLVSLALSVVSAGVSLAAGAAKAAISAARAFAKVVKVVEKLTKLLEKLRELLMKLKRGLEAYKRGFQELKELKGATKAFSKEGMIARGAKSAYTAPVRIPLGQAIGEPVPGGMVGGGVQIGKDVYHYAQSDAEKQEPQQDQGR